MFLNNSRLGFLAAAFLLTLTAVNTHAQRGGLNRPSATNEARAIIRADLDRELLLNAILPPNKDADAARQAVLKQVREDFKQLQALNNKMMAEAWSKPGLDYAFVSDMISHIRGKAARLKLNLNLPQPEVSEKPLFNKAISNASEFRATLMVLDRTIMNFVSNPLFQHPNMIEIKQGADARRDLETVISLTDDLKKTASRLGKAPHSQ